MQRPGCQLTDMNPIRNTWRLRMSFTGVFLALTAAGIAAPPTSDLPAYSGPSLFIRGFSASSYAATALAMVANHFKMPTKVIVGGLAMAPSFLMGLIHLGMLTNGNNSPQGHPPRGGLPVSLETWL